MSIKKPTMAAVTNAAKALEFAEQTTANNSKEAGTKRVNVNVSADVHRALKARAAAEGVTISELVNGWIDGWLKK